MPLTIRQRLPLYISASALAILVLQGYFIYESSVFFCEAEFRERVEARLAQADSLIARDPQHPRTAIDALPPGSLPEERILFSESHQPLALPTGLDTALFDRCTFCFAHVGQRDYAVHHDPNTHSTLVVSAIDRYGRSKLENLRNGILCGILLGVLLLALVSWYWVKKMLKPVSDKIARARDIGTKSLDLRLEVKNQYDELGQLALTFNEMLERIEKGFRSQQQFLRNASHEMRTPLTAITAEADLALSQDRTPEAYRQALQHVRTRAENLNELVAQLLLLAKVEADGYRNKQVCAADEALFATFKVLQAKYGTTGQVIRPQVEAADPSQLLVGCDPAMLQTAFLNLLDNAIKYGDGKPVMARLFPEDGYVCLEVADQGGGIAASDLPHLFEPFYRSARHAQVPGSGIGLSLVKTIAERYGGSVEAHTAQAGGTTMRFMLPRANLT
jgi:two-component system, OmpR family, sensor histidine kinase ArlS